MEVIAQGIDQRLRLIVYLHGTEISPEGTAMILTNATSQHFSPGEESQHQNARVGRMVSHGGEYSEQEIEFRDVGVRLQTQEITAHMDEAEIAEAINKKPQAPLVQQGDQCIHLSRLVGEGVQKRGRRKDKQKKAAQQAGQAEPKKKIIRGAKPAKSRRSKKGFYGPEICSPGLLLEMQHAHRGRSNTIGAYKRYEKNKVIQQNSEKGKICFCGQRRKRIGRG